MAIVNLPKLELRVAGERVFCGRPGCDQPIGRISHSVGGGKVLMRKTGVIETMPPTAGLYLSGGLWHLRTLEDGTRQWERAGRERRPLRDPFDGTAEYGGAVMGIFPFPGEVVVCPKPTCRARQRVPVAIPPRTGTIADSN